MMVFQKFAHFNFPSSTVKGVANRGRSRVGPKRNEPLTIALPDASCFLHSVGSSLSSLLRRPLFAVFFLDAGTNPTRIHASMEIESLRQRRRLFWSAGELCCCGRAAVGRLLSSHTSALPTSRSSVKNRRAGRLSIPFFCCH
jgi:hypothetical protein